MIPQWIIEQKRDGNELPPETIRTWVEAYARGDIPDYQMAALAMAIYFKG
ncbi:MAG: thymidine phosphorylase, partial [Kiritimatiellaeota bacterium]|nr:thymidine phosphorylase [Kiritimatiellota bacterium]